MTPERLKTLIEAYGADARRWPADERAAAEDLGAALPAARRWLEDARALDAALDALPAAAARAGLAQSILAEARTRSQRRGIADWLRLFLPDVPLVPQLAGFAAAVVVGFWIGFSGIGFGDNGVEIAGFGFESAVSDEVAL